MTDDQMTASAIIDAARNRERPEALVLVGSDDVAVRIAAAWGAAGVTTIRASIREPGCTVEDPESLDWLWRQTSVHVEAIARASGIGEPQILRRLPMLQANQIVYPDGTIHALVRRLLHERVLKQFGATRPKRVTTPHNSESKSRS